MDKVQTQKEEIMDQQTKTKTLNQEKQKYEWLWKFIYLGITIVSVVLGHKIYLFQTLPEFQNVRKGGLSDLLLYGIPFSILFTILDLKIHSLFDKKCQESFITLERYRSPKQKANRSYTLVKWMYSLIYYLASSIAGYLIIKDTSYFPVWLGGNGSCMNLIYTLPYVREASLSMKVFYILQFGKHLSRMMSHMFIRQEGNYYEYILHHSLSIFLIVFSYLTNMWLIGILVLLLHDLSDFFLISARTYKDYRHYSKKILKLIYVLALTFWIGCRIIVFNICCIIPGFYGAFFYVPDKLNELQTYVLWYPYVFMVFMMIALEILQLFWTYYIGSSFISVNVSEKVAKHTYD